MLAAEIHRKVSDSSPPSQRMEDTLTSSVFSAFRYLNNYELLRIFLNKACNINNKNLKLQAIDKAWFYFWPLFTFQRPSFREPDVVIFLKTKHKRNIAVLVEAKYDYGLSNITRQPAMNLENSKSERESGISLGHQLMDEYCGLKCGMWLFKDSYFEFDPQRALLETKNKYLIYITANYEIPANDILEGLKSSQRFKHCPYAEERCRFSPDEEIYWLSWRELSKIIEEIGINNSPHKVSIGELNLIIDLFKMLEVRELKPFNPFEKLLEVAIYRSVFGDVPFFQGLKEITRYKEIF